MENYNYLNSKDVAEYLKKIDYQFSPLERAWIIWHNCTMSIEKKHSAWKKLIKTTTDCEIKKERQLPYVCSLHDFLNHCIELQNRIINLYKDEKEAVYSFKFNFDLSEAREQLTENERIFDVNETDNVVYTNLDKCFNRAKEYCKDTNLSYKTLIITKKYMNEFHKSIRVEYNTDDEIINIYDIGIIDYQKELNPDDIFDYVWFAIPTPFKKGDIVKNKISNCEPFVLDDLVPNYTNDWIKEYGDESDMVALGYFVSRNGDTYYDSISNYLDLEYYNSPLEDDYRSLQCISNYLNDKISLDEALRYYHAILMEEYINRYEKNLGYREERLKLGGLK